MRAKTVLSPWQPCLGAAVDELLFRGAHRCEGVSCHAPSGKRAPILLVSMTNERKYFAGSSFCAFLDVSVTSVPVR